MSRIIVIGFGLYYALLGAYLILAPRSFFELTPGVATTGQFNPHFVVDVGIAFVVGGTGLFAGAMLRDRRLAALGVGFPLLHGVFHVVSWGRHGFPVNAVTLGDIAATAGLSLMAALAVSMIRKDAT